MFKMADDIPVTKQLSNDPVVAGFSHHADHIASDREPYGPPGLKGLIANPFVLLCAACSTLGGLLFGYDQGVVSVILVMDQFLTEFPRIEESHPGSGFAKGLLTAMIELGALVGALNQGWIADKISRRYSIIVAVIIFTIGSVLQTAAFGYPMLVVARLIGGVGIGMLSMVAPLYISEISMSSVSLDPFLPKNICSSISLNRSPRMPWYTLGPRRMVYCPRNCNRLLDHLWYTVYGWRMGLASPFSTPDDSGFRSRCRCLHSAFLSPMASFKGP
jgi:hypothetical protein